MAVVGGRVREWRVSGEGEGEQWVLLGTGRWKVRWTAAPPPMPPPPRPASVDFIARFQVTSSFLTPLALL